MCVVTAIDVCVLHRPASERSNGLRHVRKGARRLTPDGTATKATYAQNLFQIRVKTRAE